MLGLVVMGAYAYFIGTRIMLSQAEAFAFRRMTVPQLAEKGTFQFFYATNRLPSDLHGTRRRPLPVRAAGRPSVSVCSRRVLNLPWAWE